MVCVEVARRITLLMLEVAAANNLAVVVPTDTELVEIRDRTVAQLEASGACEIIAAMPDPLLRTIVENALKARDS